MIFKILNSLTSWSLGQTSFERLLPLRQSKMLFQLVVSVTLSRRSRSSVIVWDASRCVSVDLHWSFCTDKWPYDTCVADRNAFSKFSGIYNWPVKGSDWGGRIGNIQISTRLSSKFAGNCRVQKNNRYRRSGYSSGARVYGSWQIKLWHNRRTAMSVSGPHFRYLR